jgi:hypothetical protein
MELLERAVTAATAAYVSVLEVPEGTLGLVLLVYFDGDAASQLTPPAVAIPRAKLDWCLEHERLEDVWLPWDPPEVAGEELGSPDAGEDPALNALLARINDGGYEEGLLEEYLAALTRSLHAALGVLVVIEGLDVSFGAPLREQLRAQMDDEQWAEWTARDRLPRNRAPDRLLGSLDIVVSARIDPDRVAAVYERDGVLYADARLSSTRFSSELTRPVQQIGQDPAVVAGLLPDGAASVSVQDLCDDWHDGLVARGAWLCVLPHPGRGPLPPVEFRDAAGQPLPPAAPELDEPLIAIELVADPDLDPGAWAATESDEDRRVLEAARVPLLWPADAAGAPRLSSWSSDGAITLERDELSVEIAPEDVMTELEELLEDRLRPLLGDERRAARAVLEAVGSKLPGRIGGRSVTFEALAAGGAWAARRGATVAVSGDGPLPARLELVELTVDDVQPG